MIVHVDVTCNTGARLHAVNFLPTELKCVRARIN